MSRIINREDSTNKTSSNKEASCEKKYKANQQSDLWHARLCAVDARKMDKIIVLAILYLIPDLDKSNVGPKTISPSFDDNKTYVVMFPIILFN